MSNVKTGAKLFTQPGLFEKMRQGVKLLRQKEEMLASLIDDQV